MEPLDELISCARRGCKSCQYEIDKMKRRIDDEATYLSNLKNMIPEIEG